MNLLSVKPDVRPAVPFFSSGPCTKRPGWTPGALQDAVLGRSHRSKLGKERLFEVIERSRALLGIPDDYLIGIVPASDTGAVEIALWSLLGERPVDVLVWESFSDDWAIDVLKQLKLENARVLKAPYGRVVDFAAVDQSHDIVFVWNGTTSGARVPDGNWIKDDRTGLTICDATSAVFAMDLPWRKLDVVTYSWQKVLGGEAAHGMLIISPRAVERLESYQPSWPMPKIFRLTKNGKLVEGIFNGETINTPSMLCVEDYRDALCWAEKIGGLPALISRSNSNLTAVVEWVKQTPWIAFLTDDESIRSSTSICLKVVDSWFTKRSAQEQDTIAKSVVGLLEKEKVAHDIGAYRSAPPGFRIWGGATVETHDLEALFPWLDWAWATVVSGACKDT